ncbi:MAG: AraC family transcriptional regulator [Lachnospiraceae bacterium]|nr:AraC family transcriptional regulator [Lachnospiraceae bacterium]
MIKKYVEDHYDNPQFSLLEVSDHVHLSVSYICVAFKQRTGMTINQYLTQVRMEQAKKYLKNTRYSLTEVSRMVGYQDSSYFGRIFKKTYQLTPIEYRERKGTDT